MVRGCSCVACTSISGAQQSSSASTNAQAAPLPRTGLIIEFVEPHSSQRRTATFLPEVASHEGWDKQQVQCCRHILCNLLAALR